MRVGLIGRNTNEFISILLNMWKNGNSIVLIDYRNNINAIEEMLKEAEVDCCYIEDKVFFRYKMEQIASISVKLYSTEDKNIFKLDDDLYDLYSNIKMRGEALVLYSSGTAGIKKGIILNFEQLMKKVSSILNYMNLTDKDIFLIVKSFSHCSTFIGELLVALQRKIKTYIVVELMNINTILYAMNVDNITVVFLNPTLMRMLTIKIKNNNDKRFNNMDEVKLYVSGEYLCENVLLEFKRLVPGCKVINMYGMAETYSRLSVQLAESKRIHINSVGKSIDGVELYIYKDGKIIYDKNNIGIVIVKTEMLFEGYINFDDKNEILLNGEKYYNTGDVGFFDDIGELNIIGRIDDMIIINGHNIMPNVIEECIMKSEKIQDCIVQIEKNENGIDELICYYKGDNNIDVCEMLELCQNNLAIYEIPKKFLICEDIKYNQNGKKIRC